MQEQSTKGKILDVALDMFSVKGYSAVSVRDISKRIGIKESSIYYHFLNKQQIFDELIEKVQLLIKSMKDAFNKQLVMVDNIDLDSFVNAACQYINSFFLENTVYKIINMLIIEQHSNDKARQVYQELLYEIPIVHHEQVFSVLKNKKLLKEENLRLISYEYQSIILFIFFRDFCGKKYTEAEKTIAMKELNELMQRFYYHYVIY